MAFSIPHYLTLKSRPLLGLDIGPSAIRMVELSRRAGRRFQTERYAQQALPPGMVSDQHIHHPGQLAEYIAALAQQFGNRRHRIALALPAHTIVTRSLQIPAEITATALNELITAEASAYLTVPADQVRVDYQFIEQHAEAAAQNNIVLAAARREQIEDRVAAVEAAGLIPVVIDIDLYAAHAACAHAFTLPAAASSALLMLGMSQAHIALFDGHQLLQHRELPNYGKQDDVMHIADMTVRAIQLALPTGMTLTHIFIGGDGVGIDRPLLAQNIRTLSATRCDTVDALQTLRVLPGATIAALTPTASMRPIESITTVAGNNENASDFDTTAYLVACGLAMRSVPS